jgi:hypothetical protein
MLQTSNDHSSTLATMAPNQGNGDDCRFDVRVDCRPDVRVDSRIVVPLRSNGMRTTHSVTVCMPVIRR